jgi:hypothetical protein
MTVPTTQESDQSDITRHMRETLQQLIGEQVVHTLGSPDDLLGVHVRPLWKDHYRANVFVGKTVTSARIANSYFLVIDGDGNIVTSSPKIARLYSPRVSEVAEGPPASA